MVEQNHVKTNQIMTPIETAQFLRISKTTLYRLMNKRIIPFSKVGGSIRFYFSNIEQFLHDNSVQPINKNYERIHQE